MNTEIKNYKDIDSELKIIWLDFEKVSCNHCFQSFSWLNYLINFFKKRNEKYGKLFLRIHKTTFNFFNN